LNAFEGKQPDLIATREPYENFPHLNERIDRAVSVEARIDEDADRPLVVLSVATGPRGEAFELRVEPSRLLYGIDREAYIEVLKTAELAVADAEEREAEEVVGPSAGPVTELVAAYEGALKVFRSGVEGFLIAEGLDPTVAGARGAQLIDSLMATAEQNIGLDWKDREPIQARMKVACKRVLVRFGTAQEKAETVAELFVRWLRVQVPDFETNQRARPVAMEGSGP
jgi:hypothetical protein